jgi:hypothetical protein
LPDLQVRDIRPDLANRANHLMPRHEWILRHPPIIIEHANVTMTDAAVLHMDLNLTSTQQTWIIFKGFKWSSMGFGGVCFDHNESRSKLK